LNLLVRPFVLFRPALLAVLVLAWPLFAGCASSEEARRDEERAARAGAWDARHSHVQRASDADDGASPQMTVRGEEGTLNAADVESALHDHLGEIRECYSAGRRGPHPATGRVVVRFFVDVKGEVDEVSIVESSIGNPAIERCIADISVGVVFERPAGHKPMTFDYPFEFRPARQETAARQRRQ
jgi:TonB family protein